MDRLFEKKSKKAHKSTQRLISLGIPTNIAAGPLGFRAELDIEPRGGSRSSHNFEYQSDSTVTLDENDTRASRIVFQDKKREDQGLSVPGTSTAGALVGGGEHGDDPTGEYFRSLPRGRFLCGSLLLSCQTLKVLATLERKTADQR